MIGKVVGSYKITDKIGEGGMGAVYKAVHTKMDRAKPKGPIKKIGGLFNKKKSSY